MNTIIKEIQEMTKPYFAEGQTEVDITAVLNFIEHHDEVHSIKFIDNTFYILDYDGSELGTITNKPLHLYSEQEEKDLLNILKELGTQ